MAIDPNLTEDQKRRIRRDATFNASLPGATGTHLPDPRGDTPFARSPQTAAAPASAAPARTREAARQRTPDSSMAMGITGTGAIYSRDSRVPRRPEEGRSPTDRQRSLARAGVLAAEAENARGAFVDAEERAIDERQSALHGRGARRLFRGTDAQGNTVYTDRPGDPLMAGPGEERFYGADGWRIDEGLTSPGRAADVQPGRGRAQSLRREQTAFYDELDARNDQQLTAIGRRQPWVEEQTARNQQAALAQQIEGMQRLGYDADAIAKATGQGQQGGMDFGDMIRLMQFQETQNQNQINNRRLSTAENRQGEAERRQQTADLRRFSREDQDAYVREELGIIRGQDREALDEFFASDRGRLLQSVLDDRLNQAYNMEGAGAAGLEIGIDRPEGLSDLVPQPWYTRRATQPFTQRYASPSDQLQQGVSLEELGLNSGDEWILDYLNGRTTR